jgi:hypothetical protein
LSDDSVGEENDHIFGSGSQQLQGNSDESSELELPKHRSKSDNPIMHSAYFKNMPDAILNSPPSINPSHFYISKV